MTLLLATAVALMLFFGGALFGYWWRAAGEIPPEDRERIRRAVRDWRGH